MKNILVLHTGGTISMSADQSGAVAPTGVNPMAGFEKLFDNQLAITSEEFANLPSPHITPDVMLALKNRILAALKTGVDGIVITHGTDTLEETAFFLDLTLPNDVPIVLTGAMRSSNEIGADGLHNLISAVWTAASAGARNKGVLVVMNDEIHTARYVTKTHTTNVATFRTPTFGPIGIVSKQRAHFFQELIHSEICDIDHLVKPIYLIKVYAGMDTTFFDVLDNGQTKGLVIEAMGAGNLPPNLLPAVQRLLDRQIPIVLVSRCFNGVAEDVYDYEGGGVQLKKMGVIFCRGLNGPKARIKLQVGLSAGKTGQALIDFVSDAIS